MLLTTAVGFALASEACVGDSPVTPTDGGSDSSPNEASVDGGSDAIVDAAPDVNPNCADAQGALAAAIAWPMNGQNHGITFLANSTDAVIAGSHISAGLLGPDAAIPASNGQSDALAFRRTATGDVVWAQSFGGPLADGFSAVTSDSAGDVYVVGNFKSASFTLGTTINNAGSPNWLPVIAKLSGTSGAVVWAKTLTPANADSACNSIVMRGNQLVVGCSFSTATTIPLPDGGTTVLSPLGGVNGLLINLDPQTGGAVWLTPLGAYVADAGGATATVDSVDVTTQGDVIASGTFSGTNLQDKASGNPSLSLTRVSSARDGWVGEFSPTNGNAQWAKGFGSAVASSSVSVVRSSRDGTGGVLLEASYQGQIDLGSGPTTSNGSDDALLASLTNKSGAPAWQKSFGGTGAEIPQGISIDDCNRPIVAVRVSTGLTLDGVVLPAPQANSYAAVTMKLDPGGKVLWATGPTPPSTAFLSIADIQLNPNNGRTIVVGFFGGTVDLGGGNTVMNNASGPFLIAYSP